MAIFFIAETEALCTESKDQGVVIWERRNHSESLANLMSWQLETERIPRLLGSSKVRGFHKLASTTLCIVHKS